MHWSDSVHGNYSHTKNAIHLMRDFVAPVFMNDELEIFHLLGAGFDYSIPLFRMLRALGVEDR